jgi:Domain of unknown function (DUF4440)
MVRPFRVAVNAGDRPHGRLKGKREFRSRAGARQREARLRNCIYNQKMEETMNIDRRQLALAAVALGALSVVPVSVLPAFAASADDEAVAKNVEAFRAGQIAANAEALAALCAAELSYSHSDGRVEDKATFIANATNGKSKFLSLEYQDPGIRVVGPAAIVRFHWVGEQEAVADGKKSSTNLHILMNWQKQGADWKLLSRAATKL